jgi:hypothetical protein
VTNLTEDLFMAVTEEGSLLLLNKHNMKTIFSKKVTDSYIYDIIKTSRRNEWALFTHLDGLLYVSWIKPYGAESYDLVSV